MPINTIGTKPPLILVHGEDANYFLREALPDQPLFGFFHLGSDGKKVNIKSIEDYAAYYIKQLKEIVPNGPYFIGGFSFGGNLAYEMTRQLIASGDNVPILFFIDSVIQTNKALEIGTFKTSKNNVLSFIEQQYIRGYCVLRRLAWHALFTTRVPLPIKYRKPYIHDKYNLLRRNYNVREKLDTELVLFVASENEMNISYLEWDDLFKNKSMYKLEGNHESIMKNPKSINIMKELFKKHLSKYMNNLALLACFEFIQYGPFLARFFEFG